MLVDILEHMKDAQLVSCLGPDVVQHGGIQVRIIGHHDLGCKSPILEVVQETVHMVLVVGRSSSKRSITASQTRLVYSARVSTPSTWARKVLQQEPGTAPLPGRSLLAGTGGSLVCHQSLPRCHSKPSDGVRTHHPPWRPDAVAKSVPQPSGEPADRAYRALPDSYYLRLNQ